MGLLRFVIAFLFAVFALPVSSAQPATREDLAQVRAQVQELDRGVVVLKEVTANRLDAQDKRIGDLDIWTGQQANHMAAISNMTSLVGTAITLIAFGAGFIVYLSVKNRASAEAKEAAEHWFQKNAIEFRKEINALRAEADQLQSQVDKLRQKAEQAHGDIDRMTTEVDDHAKQSRLVIEQAAQQIFSASGKGQDARPVDPAAVEAIEQASLALQAKPENAFTVDDHYARGLDEFIADRFDSALVSFDKAIHAAEAEVLSFERHAGLLFARSLALIELGRFENAIATIDEIDRRYGADPAQSLRVKVAESLINKGVAQERNNRPKEAVAVYDEIDRRYGTDAMPALREQVAMALFNRGVALEQLDHHKKAIAAYDEIDRRYGTDPTLPLRIQVAMALVNKGVVLGQTARLAEAIEVYDEVDRRYGRDPSSALRERVAKALVNKALTLTQLDRIGEESEAYDEVIGRYGADSSPVLREEVAVALNGRAFNRLMHAKQYWNVESGRHQNLLAAIDDLERAKRYRAKEDSEIVLGNLGYALFLSDRRDEAEESTRECLRIGQEKSLNVQREDAKRYRVEPHDYEYERLLDRLWQEVRLRA